LAVEVAERELRSRSSPSRSTRGSSSSIYAKHLSACAAGLDLGVAEPVPLLARATG
jgi:hypothetical protein